MDYSDLVTSKSNDNVVTIFIRMEVVYGENSNIKSKSESDTKKRHRICIGTPGVPMSTAVDMFLNQIVLTGGIPFDVTLPSAPESIDTKAKSSEEIHEKIQKGYGSYKAGRTQNAEKAFERFRESHN